MTPVIAFGEALVDMLSSRLGAATDAQETFTPYAGGAPANVARRWRSFPGMTWANAPLISIARPLLTCFIALSIYPMAYSRTLPFCTCAVTA